MQLFEDVCGDETTKTNADLENGLRPLGDLMETYQELQGDRLEEGWGARWADDIPDGSEVGLTVEPIFGGGMSDLHGKGWHTIIANRIEGGSLLDIDLAFDELEEPQEIIERGPHIGAIGRITIQYAFSDKRTTKQLMGWSNYEC